MEVFFDNLLKLLGSLSGVDAGLSVDIDLVVEKM